MSVAKSLLIIEEEVVPIYGAISFLFVLLSERDKQIICSYIK
ncbi:hypothetical protein IGI50_000666 [Enterococcus sp. DIV0170]